MVRRLEKEDLPLRVEWMNDPKVYGSMHFAVPVSMENTVRWYENNIENDKRFDAAFEENGEIVAFGGLTGINRETNKAELYVFVNPAAQRGGIGTRATQALCRFGFERLGLEKIYLETNEDNMAAQHVYEKCGFRLEGKLRNEYRSKNGQLMSRLYYGLIKGELEECV